MKPKVVWLDLDDTLWDFHGNSRIVLGKLYHKYNLATHFTSVQAWIDAYEEVNHRLWAQYNVAGITKDYLLQQRFLQPLLNAGHPDAYNLGVQFDSEYLDILALLPVLVPGALQLLADLRSRGYLTGVLSNGFTSVQHRKIRNSGLEPYIDIVVLSDDIGVNKPDVRLFQHAQHVAGNVRPDDCIMLGDNPDTDIRGAVNAGWSAVLFAPQGKHTGTSKYPITHDSATDITADSTPDQTHDSTPDFAPAVPVISHLADFIKVAAL